MKERIAIIGAGKVGTAIGYLLKERGYTVCAVASRRLGKAIEAQAVTGGIATSNPAEAAKIANVIFITTQDRYVEKVCDTIAESGCFQQGDSVFHFSGALPLEVLGSAEERGALTGCIHPLQSFADVSGAIRTLPGSFFGVTAPNSLLPLAKRLVSALQGEVLLINDEDKPVYHAAACVASNYLVSLLFMAEEMLSAISVQRKSVSPALLPLVQGTLNNIQRKGSLAALTGPISRGDEVVIKQHLWEIKERLPHLLPAYKEMAKVTAEIALARGSITRNQLESLKELLIRDGN